MSIRYEINGNSFLHKIEPESVGEITHSVFLHGRRRSSHNRRDFFRTLWNTFSSCSPLTERDVTEAPHPVECNWSKRVMIDSIEERNIRLTACYIPNLKLVINYLNAVRKHQGKPHSEIEAAEQELPQSSREMLDYNYSQVVAKHSRAAFEEAIVIHEVLMFEGAHAIPSYHPELDHTTQSSRSEGYTISEALSINTSPRIDGIQILQMLKEDDVKTAYHLLEQLCREQLGTPTFNDDVTYITEKLNTQENDISYFVALILRNGRQNDFSSHRYQQHLLSFEHTLKSFKRPLATPEESSRSEPVYPPQWADILPLPRGTQCDTCYDDTATTFKTTCCCNLVCLNCFSKNIETQGKMAFEGQINQRQIIKCLRCESLIKLDAYQQKLSKVAQRILSYFHRRSIANLDLTHPNGIIVSCDDDTCKTTYIINNNQCYFQCDNIEHHSDQCVRLHHSTCGTLWTHEHNCPQLRGRCTNENIEKIKNIQYMIDHIDTVKPCIGRKKNNCKAFFEKRKGRSRNCMVCTQCDTAFCWLCEKKWSNYHIPCDDYRQGFSIKNRDKRLKQLNQTLITLKKSISNSS